MRQVRTFLSLVAALFVALPVSSQNDFPSQPVPKLHSPTDSQKLFQLPEGYSLELVLSEPQIKEPAVAVFDGDGKFIKITQTGKRPGKYWSIHDLHIFGK